MYVVELISISAAGITQSGIAKQSHSGDEINRWVQRSYPRVDTLRTGA
jgi:hypothetical protein